MSEINEKKIPDDEIDIKFFLDKIKSFFGYIFSLYTSNLIVTILFLFLTVITSFAFKKFSVKIYSSSFIIKPSDRFERIHLKILGDLETRLKYKDYSALSRDLKLDSLICKKIVALQSFNASIKNPIDSVNSTEVTISILDYEQLIPVQNAILAYLEGNPFFSKIRELQKKQIELELEVVNKDLFRLDSLKNMQLRYYGKESISQQHTLPFNEVINPMASYTTANDRINKKSNLIARSVFIDNFQLVKPCIIVKKPIFPPRVLILSIYLLPFFMLVCLIYLHFRTKRLTKESKSSE